MKTRFTLASRILLLALGNLFLIGLAFTIFLRLEVRQEFGYFLMTAGRDRARAVAQRLAIELPRGDPAGWDAILNRYSAANGVTFLIYDNHGKQAAGPHLDPPAAVKARLHPKVRLADGSLPDASWLPPFIVIADAPVPYWLGVWLPISQKDVSHENPSRWELVLASPTLASNPFFFHLAPWFGIAGIALLITLLCWLPIVRSLTRTIEQMRHATASIAEGRFDIQLHTGRKDELGHLGASINRMATSLDMFTRGRNRFLGAVAHELRSPLGRMQAVLGILERGDPAFSGNPRAEGPIADLREEVELMSNLTEELLTFARSRLVPEALQLVPTNLAAVVSRVIRAERTAGAVIHAEIDPGIFVEAGPEYLFRSIANTLRNAVRYAGSDGVIAVVAEAREGSVVLTVSDCGPGIPEEALERIFTPFFRLDASRDRRSGGTGLGMSIVRGCIEACHGSVVCRNRTPTGLEVTITLQAAQAVPEAVSEELAAVTTSA